MKTISDSTILIVDDAESNIDILVEALGDEYEIGVATDGESALEYISKNIPDLILLDIIMPGMDGYDVIRRLKADKQTRDIPVIFCTIMDDVEDETRGLELGALDYIRKPFSPPVVKARVKNHLLLKLAQEDLVKQNEILRENVRLREEVERITKHDLRTPLNSVINLPYLMLQEGNLSEGQIELLKMLEESGYRMLEIINSSLDLYKMETGRYALQEAPVNLLRLVQQIHGESRDVIIDKNIKIDIRLRGAAPGARDEFIVSGDDMLCYSMLANLIKNALEASPSNKAVAINLDDAAGPVVSIHNEGAIPEEIRDRFFEKYATAGKKEGSGLGVYSANLMAGTMGGKIEFETSEQTGTSIFIHLKKYTEKEPDERPGSAFDVSSHPCIPPASLTRRSRVLVVDGYPSMRRTIISIMKQMGFTSFLEAENGLEASNLLGCNTVGLVISDINTAQKSGLELLECIRSNPDQKETPFILITGEAVHQTVIDEVKKRRSDHIVKPFTAEKLKRKIEKYMA